MKYKLKIIIFLILFSFKAYAQFNMEVRDDGYMKLYNHIQNFYGLDDEIVNGYQYIFPSKKINGNPFLKDEKWNKATIFINSKSFSDYKIKYDLVNNIIIINVISDKGYDRIIGLNKFNVDSFSLDSLTFVNSKVLLPKETMSIFYQKIYKGKISLYRKYNKRFINLYDEMSPNGKFSTLKNNLFLLKNNEIHNINNIYTFLHLFDKIYRKEIKLFINNHNLKLKTASDNQLNILIGFCNTLISK